MRRYRWGLLALIGLVAVSVLVAVVRGGSPGPPFGEAGAPAASELLLPVQDRPTAPELSGVEGWLNSPPLRLPALRGKVVLLDFWTYSCINCVRTFPHLQALQDRYGQRGLVIIGVHSPEFDFEKVRDNVAGAARRLGVTWPVALDPGMSTWRAYGNNVWPAEYLIDQSGRLSYRHLGEGEYGATERAVAGLLSATAPSPGSAGEDAPDTPRTPELYAGSERGKLADGERYGDRDVPTAYADHGPPTERDVIQITGTWSDHGQYILATAPGHVRLSFHAETVLIVAGTESATPAVAGVTVDGRRPASDQRGAGLGADGLTVGRNDLFPLLIAQDPGHHLLDLSVPAGFQLYTFTFG
ncbi:MAG: redoxin family protein [Candidatus Dormibacteria bacterium]